MVDDDIDPTNLEDVMWAVCTRCEPSEDIEIMRKSWGSKADPLLRDQQAPVQLASDHRRLHALRLDQGVPARGRGQPGLLRSIRGKWGELFSDPRFPLPEGAISNADVDDESHGQGVQVMGSSPGTNGQKATEK